MKKTKNNLYFNFSYEMKECYIKTIALHPESKEIWMSPDHDNYYIGQVVELLDPKAAGYTKIPAKWDLIKLVEIAGFLAPAGRMVKYIVARLENGVEIEELLKNLKSKDAKDILEAAIIADQNNNLHQFVDVVKTIRNRRVQRVLNL